MTKLYRNKQGKKLYPVCSWEENQHKLYNAHDRIMNSIYDAQEVKPVRGVFLLMALLLLMILPINAVVRFMRIRKLSPIWYSLQVASTIQAPTAAE